jgi:hypothetical protein
VPAIPGTTEPGFLARDLISFEVDFGRHKRGG